MLLCATEINFPSFWVINGQLYEVRRVLIPDHKSFNRKSKMYLNKLWHDKWDLTKFVTTPPPLLYPKHILKPQLAQQYWINLRHQRSWKPFPWKPKSSLMHSLLQIRDVVKEVHNILDDNKHVLSNYTHYFITYVDDGWWEATQRISYPVVREACETPQISWIMDNFVEKNNAHRLRNAHRRLLKLISASSVIPGFQ